jgi:hypothetical protein
LIPAQTAVMAPPARTLNSAAVAADDSNTPAKDPYCCEGKRLHVAPHELI